MAIRAVTVNFRTPDMTSRAVSSVLDDDPEAEVVVVDNASGDDSVTRLTASWSDPRVTIVSSGANLGYGRGINLGAAGSASDFVLVLNSDALVQPGALRALTDELTADPRLALTAPHVVTPDGSPQPDAFGSFPSLRTMVVRSNRDPAETLEPDWVSGVAFLVRRDAFEGVGGFDARYWMYFEDIDLCRRLRARGWRIRRSPNAVVEHVGGASRITTATQAAQYRASQSRYLRSAGYPALPVWTLNALRRPVDRLRSLR
jgi:N-acetylglucosaminyl-diphospho-decaprenol L-rhamnosyltransferase